MFCRRTPYFSISIWHLLSVIFITCLVCACAGSKDEEESSQRKPAADEIKVNLIADSDINPNDSGRPAPLNIFLYGIRDRDVFTSADFFDVVDGKSKSVQAAASKIYEAILQPGEQRTIFIKPDSGVRALGAVAAYRDLENAIWMSSWEIPETKQSWWQLWSPDSPEVNARFQKTTVTIKKMD